MEQRSLACLSAMGSWIMIVVLACFEVVELSCRSRNAAEWWTGVCSVLEWELHDTASCGTPLQKIVSRSTSELARTHSVVTVPKRELGGPQYENYCLASRCMITRTFKARRHRWDLVVYRCVHQHCHSGVVTQ